MAKLFAGILADLGLLSKGEVVLKTASDFVGSVLGESESKTRSILKASEGCVLVIDEAYSLGGGGFGAPGGERGGGSGGDPYRVAVVDTLVEQVRSTWIYIDGICRARVCVCGDRAWYEGRP